MFLNRIYEYSKLVGALEPKPGLDAVSANTHIPRNRIEELKLGVGRITPVEEWALIGFCETNNLYGVLSQYQVVPPAYNRHGDFRFDLRPEGLEVPIPRHELATRPTNLLGYEVDFPLGIPACALTPNHHWLRFYIERGFSIVTHKTVRAKEWEGHDPPHWAYVKDWGNLQYPFTDAWATAGMDTWPEHPAKFSMLNSFGVPSLPPEGSEGWQAEIERDLAVLKPGTVLIVSVMGTPEEANTEEELKQDFANVARMAKEAGAQIIEANYSCPNTKGGVEDVYTNPGLTASISEAIRKEIGKDTPLLIKIGYLPGARLEAIVEANAEWIDGIVAINTIRVAVNDSSGNQFFSGASRARAGVSGSLIKLHAKEVVGNLIRLKEHIKPELAILGVGGVTTAEDVEEFLELGATAVLTCTGAWMNPNLAIEARLARRVGRQQLEETFGKEAVAAAYRFTVDAT